MRQAKRLASNFVSLNDEYKDFAGHLLISSYAFDAEQPVRGSG